MLLPSSGTWFANEILHTKCSSFIYKVPATNCLNTLKNSTSKWRVNFTDFALKHWQNIFGFKIFKSFFLCFGSKQPLLFELKELWFLIHFQDKLNSFFRLTPFKSMVFASISSFIPFLLHQKVVFLCSHKMYIVKCDRATREKWINLVIFLWPIGKQKQELSTYEVEKNWYTWKESEWAQGTRIRFAIIIRKIHEKAVYHFSSFFSVSEFYDFFMRCSADARVYLYGFIYKHAIIQAAST